MLKIIFPIAVMFIFFTSFACSKLESKSKIKKDELAQALTFARLIELNKYNPDITKELKIRIYETPVFSGESCFVETHGICEYDYYIAVSEYDEYPAYNTYKLGRFGEITDYQWLKVDKTDYARLLLTINKYPQAALKNNPGLNNLQYRQLVKVTVTQIEQTLKK